MKRWVALTVLLYAFALILLTVPVILIAFGNWGLNNNNNNGGLHGTLQIYLAWGYWLWLAIMVAGQAFGSGGTIENSPAFQRREGMEERRVTQGRLK